jgi:NADH:ubiquinone oxidoreductase subunit K
MNFISYLFIFFAFFNIFFKYKDFIIIILSLELLLIGISLKFIYFSIIFDLFSSFLFSLFILILGATESAIALSLLIIYYLNNKSKG